MKALFNDTIIAESNETIIIEGNHYFPPASLQKEYFSETDMHTTCPWKGYASYYTISVKDKSSVNAGWFYPDPKSGALEIKDYVAFYPNMIKITD